MCRLCGVCGYMAVSHLFDQEPQFIASTGHNDHLPSFWPNGFHGQHQLGNYRTNLGRSRGPLHPASYVLFPRSAFLSHVPCYAQKLSSLVAEHFLMNLSLASGISETLVSKMLFDHA